MLSYDDSLELERRGYRQELKHGDWYYNKSDNKANILAQKKFGPFLYCVTCHEDEPPERAIKVPTTDGMIKGLGKDFHILTHLNYPSQSYSAARGRDKRKKEELYWETADTPEQAVCELWKKVKNGNS